MCGICGVVGLEDKKIIKKMVDSIKYRGPDAQGFFTDRGISLGHNRLSIIDLSKNGKQPLCNEDETIWVVFNGEIYNFLTLRNELEKAGHKFKSNSDTEVLVHAYEEWGKNFLQRLKGDYAFGIWDSAKKQLLLARDYPGVCPLYYFFDKKKSILYFASEIKALLKAQVPRKINLEALNDFLSLQYTLGPQTMFKDIYKVQPGEIITFHKGVLLKKKAVMPQSHTTPTDNEQAIIVSLKKEFTKSVERRLLSEVPLGVYLSGGLDSSFIVATMKSLKDDVKTFSINFGMNSDDEKYSRLIAEKFNTNHTELFVDANNYRVFPQVAWHMDEPAADIAALPTFLMAKEAKKHVTVILTGDGGDEVFGGYKKYARLELLHKMKAIVKYAKYFPGGLNLFGDKERLIEISENVGKKDSLLLSYTSAISDKEKHKYLTQCKDNKTLEKISGFFENNRESYLKQLMEFDIQTLLPDDYLMKVNKMSMAFSLEPRVPFLDMDFMELTQQIPTKLKVNGNNTKIIMRKALRDILPPEVVKRKKQGFNVPTKPWLNSELGEIAEQILLEKENKFFKQEFIEKVLQKSRQNEVLWSKRFWTIFSFECWRKIFIEPSELKQPNSFQDIGL